MAAARRRPPQPVHELCPPRLPPSSGGPLILLVERQRSPHEALCQLTVVSCDPEALAHHEAAATPPKIRFATCLTLRDVRLARLRDEAFWAVLWYAASADNGGKLSAHQMLYELLLSFVAEVRSRPIAPHEP